MSTARTKTARKAKGRKAKRGPVACAFCGKGVPYKGDEPLGPDLILGWREYGDPAWATVWVHVKCFRSALTDESRELFDLD